MSRGLDRLPEHMRASAQEWVQRGRPHPQLLGSFFRSVLLNDLSQAAAHADTVNQRALYHWACWLWNDVPALAWGSEQRLLEWWAAGGLEGPPR